jgi:hypothetical protein
MLNCADWWRVFMASRCVRFLSLPTDITADRVKSLMAERRINNMQGKVLEFKGICSWSQEHMPLFIY